MHHSRIDRLAQGDEPAHRLDARAKLLALLAYTLVLVSFDRYAVSILAPMAVLPAAMMWLGRVPAGLPARRLLVMAPLIAMVALASPLYDRLPQMVAMGPWRGRVAGGWLTAASVTIRFVLGLTLLTAVTATTPMPRLLAAMRRLGLPALLVEQIGMLYRYLFVLLDEASHVRRARLLRGGGRAPVGRRLAATGGAIGSLFLRTLERSQRIHVAMQARGYRGTMPVLRPGRMTAADGAFLVLVAGYLVACRWLYPLVTR